MQETNSNEQKYIVGEEEAGIRIDAYAASRLEDKSRSYVQKLLREGQILCNDKTVKANYRIQPGDRVTASLPVEKELEIRPENIPLDILYEDEELLVVNKPKQMVVHPSAGHTEHTLVNALLYHCAGSLSGINGVMRPGIGHRIDQDTTGALVVCKTDRAHHALAEQLAVHSITRRYRAICIGTLKEEEITITGNIGRHPTDRKKMALLKSGGKTAVTHVKLLQNLSKGYAYIECTLETGRTHQIRVHMASIGHPILGDPVYGPKKSPVGGLQGQVLHAMVIGFIHPVTGEYLEITAPLPDAFKLTLKKLT